MSSSVKKTTYIVATQKKGLAKALLMSTHNICTDEELEKLFQNYSKYTTTSL